MSLLSVCLWNSRRRTRKLCSLSVLFFILFCSHAWLCAEMPEVSYSISVSWMFIQVRGGEGRDEPGGRGKKDFSRLTCCSFCEWCEEVDKIRMCTFSENPDISLRFVNFASINMIHMRSVQCVFGCRLLLVKSAMHFCPITSSAPCITWDTHNHMWMLLLE